MGCKQRDASGGSPHGSATGWYACSGWLPSSAVRANPLYHSPAPAVPVQYLKSKANASLGSLNGNIASREYAIQHCKFAPFQELNAMRCGDGHSQSVFHGKGPSLRECNDPCTSRGLKGQQGMDTSSGGGVAGAGDARTRGPRRSGSGLQTPRAEPGWLESGRHARGCRRGCGAVEILLLRMPGFGGLLRLHRVG